MTPNPRRRLPQPPAALKGSGQIGFTIISLTVSLIAVLIPLLFMQDVVGRLFREFAITLAVTILISAVVSLTLVPMMCAKLLKQRSAQESGHWFAAVVEWYGRRLTWVLDHQIPTLWVATATVVVTITGHNDAPVITVDNPAAVTEGNTGTPAPVTVAVADHVAITDVDTSDVHTPYVTNTLAFDGGITFHV